MILVCEIGDKTFFIGAIMAMQHPPVLVFTGAFGALIVMTILSSLIGFALPNLLPKQYTHYAAAVLFLYFGYVIIYRLNVFQFHLKCHFFGRNYLIFFFLFTSG